MADDFKLWLENKFNCLEESIETLKVSFNIDPLEIEKLSIRLMAYKEVLDQYKREQEKVKIDFDKIRSEMGL